LHHYGATSILIGPDVKMDVTTEGVVVLAVLLLLLLGLGGVVLDVGRARVGGIVVDVDVVVKSERGQNDGDVDEKVLKALLLSLSIGGVEGIDEDVEIVVVVVIGSVNVKGGN